MDAMQQQASFQTLRWKIDGRLLRDIKSGARTLFQSALFTKHNLPWTMELELKGPLLLLYICLRPFPKHITSLSLYRQCFLSETQAAVNGNFTFAAYCEVDRVMEINVSDIQHCEQMTFIYDFTLSNDLNPLSALNCNLNNQLNGNTNTSTALSSLHSSFNCGDSNIANIGDITNLNELNQVNPLHGTAIANGIHSASSSSSSLPVSSSSSSAHGLNPEAASFSFGAVPSINPLDAMNGVNPLNPINPNNPMNAINSMNSMNALNPINSMNSMNSMPSINGGMNAINLSNPITPRLSHSASVVANGNSLSMTTVPTHWSNNNANHSMASGGSVSSSSSPHSHLGPVSASIIGKNDGNDSLEDFCGTLLTKLETVCTKLVHLENRVDELENKRTVNWNVSSDEEKEGEIVMVGKVDRMLKRMTLLERKLSGLGLDGKDEDDVEDSERAQLRQWMAQKVRLPEYFDLFIDSGIEDLGTAALLSFDTISRIGIDKVGHQMRILNEVDKLKVNEGKKDME